MICNEDYACVTVAQRGKGGLKMKKTLAKAIMLSVLTMAVTSGIAYAEQDTAFGGHYHKNEKMDFTNKEFTESGIKLNDPNIMHNAPGTHVHGHTDQCGEQVDDTSLTIGDLNNVTDKLVENDKALAKKIKELERTPGPKGDTGEKGEKGDTGAQGEKGEKGDTGAQGEKGEKGDTGAQGEKGEKGDTGAQGEKGEKGDTGAQGEKGDTGAQGEKGEKGDTGAQGEKGEKGDQGIQGERGADGKDGADGEDGASIAAGTYKVENNTVVMPIKYTNGELAGNVTISDVASAAQNEKEHTEFRERFDQMDHRVDSLGSRVDKVGAGALALAALHPMDFDPDDKLTFAAGYGNYKGKNAAAVGAFYRPDEKVMLSVGGTFGNGENMVNAGISFSLDRTARVSNSRTAMAKEIVDLRANVANLTALVGQLTAGMGGTIEMDRMKLFPDVPENHWAYEYIGRLAAAGLIEGYPDGMFPGTRMLSRYEFAAMLYRALEKGVKLDHKLVREFEPEMGRIHVARISGADGDRGKIERVRVYGGDNRDHYGSKLN